MPPNAAKQTDTDQSALVATSALLCSHRKVGQISGQSRAASVFITAVLGTELIDEKHEVKPIRAVINGFAKFK